MTSESLQLLHVSHQSCYEIRPGEASSQSNKSEGHCLFTAGCQGSMGSKMSAKLPPSVEPRVLLAVLEMSIVVGSLQPGIERVRLRPQRASKSPTKADSRLPRLFSGRLDHFHEAPESKYVLAEMIRISFRGLLCYLIFQLYQAYGTS